MLRFHVEVKITHIGSGSAIHTASYDADGEHTHRLLFAIDPLEAAHFSADQDLAHDPKSKRPRKEAHP